MPTAQQPACPLLNQVGGFHSGHNPWIWKGIIEESEHWTKNFKFYIHTCVHICVIYTCLYTLTRAAIQDNVINGNVTPHWCTPCCFKHNLKWWGEMLSVGSVLSVMLTIGLWLKTTVWDPLGPFCSSKSQSFSLFPRFSQFLPDADCHTGTPLLLSAKRCSARHSVARATGPRCHIQGELWAVPCLSHTCGSKSADTEAPWSPSVGETAAEYFDQAAWLTPPCAGSVLLAQVTVMSAR